MTSLIAVGSFVLIGCAPATSDPEPPASPSAEAPDGRSPQEQLFAAVKSSDVVLAAIAIERNADVDFIDDTNNNALSLAITRDDAAMVELLVLEFQ